MPYRSLIVLHLYTGAEQEAFDLIMEYIGRKPQLNHDEKHDILIYYGLICEEQGKLVESIFAYFVSAFGDRFWPQLANLIKEAQEKVKSDRKLKKKFDQSQDIDDFVPRDEFLEFVRNWEPYEADDSEIFMLAITRRIDMLLRKVISPEWTFNMYEMAKRKIVKEIEEEEIEISAEEIEEIEEEIETSVEEIEMQIWGSS
jgi:hypothetical protein